MPPSSPALPGFLQALLMPESLRTWVGGSGDEQERGLAVSAGRHRHRHHRRGHTVFLRLSVVLREQPPEYKDRVESFFARMRMPVDAVKEGTAYQDEIVYRLLGAMCMVYGAFVLLLMLIPNGIMGRLCFLFVGGIMGLGGAVLYGVSIKKRRKAALEAAGVQAADVAQ